MGTGGQVDSWLAALEEALEATMKYYFFEAFRSKPYPENRDPNLEKDLTQE